MEYRSTRQVEQLLGVNNLSVKIFQGRIAPPEKGPTGQYMWTELDIEKASWVLRRKSADDVLPKKPEPVSRRETFLTGNLKSKIK